MLDFEVTWDLKALDMETHLVMGPYHDILEDGEWIRWVRRLVKRDDLYVIHNRIQGTFVLVQMLWWEPRVCSEIEVLPGPPGHSIHLKEKIIKARCRYGADLMEEVKQDILLQKENRKRTDQLNEDSRKDLMNHSRKYGRDTIADAVGSGSYVARENRTDAANELASTLADKAKGRVINTG